MARIFTLALLSVAFYFGITFLIELRKPVVKELTSEMPEKAAEKAAETLPLPDVVLGHFKLDRSGSQQWINDQTGLGIELREFFADRHTAEQELGFNGKNIWLGGQSSVLPVKILEVTDSLVSFRVLDQNNPHTAFLQWDAQGAVWYSDYTHKKDGQQKLYRARYRKSQ